MGFIMCFIMGIIMVSIVGHSHRLVLRRHPAKAGRGLHQCPQCQQHQQQLQFKKIVRPNENRLNSTTLCKMCF
jgi:hypothetical protein